METVELNGCTALVTGAALALLGLAGDVDTVHGDVVADGLVERAIGEYEVDSAFHLAAQTQVGTAHRSPPFEANIWGPGRCSRPAANMAAPE